MRSTTRSHARTHANTHTHTNTNTNTHTQYDLFGDIEDQQGGSGGGGADAFDIFQQFFSRGGAGGGQGGGIHFEFQPFGGFAGGGGAHQFFFEEEDPTEIDIGECVNMCVIQHRQAGHIGDLETHCYHQCAAQVQEEFGQHSAFEHAFGGHGGFHQLHQKGGGGFGGGGFGGGGFGGGADARASVLEHMMRGGGFGGMHAGGFAGDRHYMHDHGYGHEEPVYEPQTETVLMEDEYGNRWYQEVEVDDMQGQHFDHYSGRPAGAASVCVADSAADAFIWCLRWICALSLCVSVFSVAPLDLVVSVYLCVSACLCVFFCGGIAWRIRRCLPVACVPSLVSRRLCPRTYVCPWCVLGVSLVCLASASCAILPAIPLFGTPTKLVCNTLC